MMLITLMVMMIVMADNDENSDGDGDGCSGGSEVWLFLIVKEVQRDA